ncbi:MAG TPA: hypothetical protein VIK86_03270, partial [Candidatus Paceibacterota bacterium]
LKINFFHICETAIIENQTGNMSIIGIFANINAQKFPVIHPQMTIVAGFEADKPGSYDVELVFLDEQGEILKSQAKINIGNNLKGNWFNKIVMYQIPRDLTQKIIIKHEGKDIHTGYLTINNK